MRQIRQPSPPKPAEVRSCERMLKNKNTAIKKWFIVTSFITAATFQMWKAGRGAVRMSLLS